MKMTRLLKRACVVGALLVSMGVSADSLLREGDTVVLIGDSITEQSYRNKGTGFYHQLTNAAALTVPEKKLTFIPLGYSGFQIGSWSAMERESLKRDRWTNYRDPGWNLRKVFAEKVDVIAIFLGMNDILQPSIRDAEADIAKWQSDTRKFVHNLRERCHPRQFVFCTTTPIGSGSSLSTLRHCWATTFRACNIPGSLGKWENLF